MTKVVRRSSSPGAPLLGPGWFAVGFLALATACSPSRVEPVHVPPKTAQREVPKVRSNESDSPVAPEQTFKNPVLPGTHPDPSVVRVGSDYYLVTSSFEYFPGVPLFQSRDLVHWKQIGHVLSRESQLDLTGIESSQGVFAPTIRYHEGTFYMVTTNMTGGGSFYVTATDPKGPWSDPVWVKESVFTMDPSLFFDDDGKVYYTRHGGKRHGAIYQSEIDIETGELAFEPRKIWEGTGDIWPEGPHLYKVDGSYYLLISEGGTSYEHMITAARADSPSSPFEPHPRNPIFTHRDLPEHPIQATGHGDLVQTQRGDFWLVLLGIRPSTPKRHHIGRETFLAPVSWEDGWPVINGKRPLALEMSRSGLPPPHLYETLPQREEFDGDELGVVWSFVRNPDSSRYELNRGRLLLRGAPVSLDELGAPTAVFQPQVALRMRASTRVSLSPNQPGKAGLVVRGNEDNHYDLLLEQRWNDGKVDKSVALRIRRGGKTIEEKHISVSEGAVELAVEGGLQTYEFFVKKGEVWQKLGQGPTTAFAYEETGSFTGAYVGLYAYSPQGQETEARFDWFEMKSRE